MKEEMNEKSVVLRWFAISVLWVPISEGYSHSIRIFTQYFKFAQLTVWLKLNMHNLWLKQ